jgi:adenine phosphoribosyltransferase
MKRIIDSFKDIPICIKGEYHYFVHPLSDGIPSIDPTVLDEVAKLMARILPAPEEFDIILTAEAMGIPLSTAISLRTGRPYSVARKRSYGIDGEISLRQVTGYSENDLYLNLPPGRQRIVIVDDVLSTGGTLKALVEGARYGGNDVVASAIFANKMKKDRLESFQKELGCPVRYLLDVEVVNMKCIVKDAQPFSLRSVYPPRIS